MGAWGHWLVRSVVPAQIGPQGPLALWQAVGGPCVVEPSNQDDTLGHLRGMSCTRGPTGVLSINNLDILSHHRTTKYFASLWDDEPGGGGGGGE
jgi:hypothetical protein